MKANPLTWISALLVSILFAGLAAITYFLVTQATNIKTLTNQKADLANLYDRATFDEKILGKQGPVGPKGPKGDPGLPATLQQIQKDYPFSELAKLKVGTPVFLRFTKNFSNASFVNTEFAGAVVSSNQKQKVMIGDLHDLSSYFFKGAYKITASLDASQNTNWVFTLKTIDDLKNFDKIAQVDAKLAKKADWQTSYDKKTIDSFVAAKSDKTDTYTKAEIDAKVAGISRSKITYTTSQVDTKLQLKKDKSSTYTKATVDNKLAAKADKGVTYIKTAIDSNINAKRAKTDTYTKTEIDKKQTEYYFNWTKFVKTELPAQQVQTTIYGDLNFKGQFTDDSTPTSIDSLGLGSESAVFHKGDRVKIQGVIITDTVGWQGLVFSIINKHSKHARVRTIKHWNRWYDGSTLKSQDVAQDLTAVSGNLIDNYPIIIYYNHLKNNFNFALELFFNDDAIFVYAKTFSESSTQNNSIAINTTLVVIDYPESYNDSEGLYINYLKNVKFDYTTSKKLATNADAALRSRSNIVFIRDWSNREFANKVWHETRTFSSS